MSKREHGYSFLGRYNILDRATHQEGWDWLIKDVFKQFGSDISNVISMGCSVGVNEIILGINYPTAKITGIDVDGGAIEKAKAGVWSLDDIRPSGLCIPEDDDTLKKLYEHFCPNGYFDIDFQKGTLRLTKPVDNVHFEVKDGTKTQYPEGSFDLAMMYMLAGEECHPYSPAFVRLGREVERIVKPNGLFWNESGLFRIISTEKDESPYRRVLNRKNSYEIECKPTEREFLFPPPSRV
jgi:SAM-dependent methyltransferase